MMGDGRSGTEMLEVAFRGALQHTHGWLLVPEIAAWKDDRSDCERLRFDIGPYSGHVAIDAFVLRQVPRSERGSLLEKPFATANQVVALFWDNLWHKASCGYMVCG